MAAKEKAPKEKEVVVATHGVFYTDGGCKPSRGIGGYGVHGYTYIEEKAKQGTGCKVAIPTADGYVMGESGIPEITLVQYVDAVGSMIPEATNNIAELKALLKTFEIVKTLGLKQVLIKMDSKYVKESMESGVTKWEANGWLRADGQPVANQDYMMALSAAKKTLEADCVIIQFGWVKGHSDQLGNDLADSWASKGIMAGRNDIQVDEIIYSDAKGYWNTKTDVNRMFSQPNWYFNSKLSAYSEQDGRYVYHLGEPREDDELIGKKMVDAAFCVLQMVEPEPVLEMIRRTHSETDILQYGNPVLGRLDDIFNKDVYADLVRFDNRFIRRDFHNGQLFVSGEAPIGRMLTRELRPARLAFSAMDSLYALEGILNIYLRNGEGTHQLSTDITPDLYETTVQGKKEVFKLKASITTTERTLPVKVKYELPDGTPGETTVVLTLGHDLPDRNTLAALADQEPKVHVVVWPESMGAVRYATIVETISGRGIWSAIYSNLQLLHDNPLPSGVSSS